MELLGCLMFLLVMACVVAFFVVAAMWMIVGTFILLFKLVTLMAYVGAAFVVIGIVAWLLAKLTSSLK